MKVNKLAAGAVLGAIGGALAGVLFAPKSGKETREDIKKMVDDIKNDVVKKVTDMGELTRDKYNKVISGIVAGYQEAKRITPDQAKEITDALSESFDKIEKVAKKEVKKK